MKKWPYRIILLITGVFLALSILEIHGDNSRNTFHDEDDVYVQSTTQSLTFNFHFEKQSNFSKNIDHTISILLNLLHPSLQANIDPSGQKDFAFSFIKRFLRNSVWRI